MRYRSVPAYWTRGNVDLKKRREDVNPTENLLIRAARETDAGELLAIYTPYVTDTAVTFEYVSPTEAEFAGRIRHTLENYPYLVAEKDGEILGYAYTGAFHSRAAYRLSAEVSIYLRRDAIRRGIGGRLYTALEEISKRQRIQNLYACIAVPEVEDKYLTFDSVRFHERMGYTLAGTFRQCGYKFERFYNMVWMEKQIGAHDAPAKPFLPIKEITDWEANL